MWSLRVYPEAFIKPEVSWSMLAEEIGAMFTFGKLHQLSLFNVSVYECVCLFPSQTSRKHECFCCHPIIPRRSTIDNYCVT